MLNTKGIGSAEERAYVLRRAHIVEDYRNGEFIYVGALLECWAAKFFVKQFSHL